MTKAGSSSADTSRYRVLVVDDEPLVRELVIILLEQNLAVICDPAESAAAAMNRLQTNMYHALLTDYCMTGGSGTELVLSARQLWPDLVCGLISGVVGPEDMQKLPANIFFLAKPFTRQQLIDKMRQAMAALPAA